MTRCFLTVAVLAGASCALAQTPEWIWHDNKGQAPPDPEVRVFRKTFTIEQPVSKAVLTFSGDDRAMVYLNSRRAGANRNWNQSVSANVTEAIQQGANILAIRGHNASGDAAIIARLELTLPNEQKRIIITDTNWISAAETRSDWFMLNHDTAGWTKVVSRGKLGVQPWGDVMAEPVATPADKLTVLPGFKVELLHSATREEGSWICIAVDPKGRLIISPQSDQQPMLRVTLALAGQVEKIEPIPAPLRQAMGLLYAHDSLYANCHGPKGTGLYRVIDSNQNDQFDAGEVQLLKNFKGEGEHGYHAVVAGPDGMIYVMNGNHTQVPEEVSAQSPHQDYREDLLLPRQWDGNGHARGIMAPGGYIVRTDPEGKKWELLLAGFRNAYDFDFNEDGEIFTYDSDMEWDWGTPWYRPTPIYHCVSGGEYGWRSGTGKWPWYYPDCLPAAAKVGIGSPTGTKFGTGAKFPAKYQKAFYAMDWSYGRIVAVHLTPNGASYDGELETFIVGKPLNVTDLEIGKDGAMYFITGGRGTQSGLYRASYTDSVTTAETPDSNRAAAQARKVRRELEAFHGRKDPGALEFAWPHLNSDDRFIRYAARIAVESQPVDDWSERALNERRVNASLTALTALARKGPKQLQRDLHEALGELWPNRLTDEQKIDALRISGLSFIRMGAPDRGLAEDIVKAVDPLFPSTNPDLNRELAQILIYLEAPGVVKKALGLVATAPTQEDQLHYIFHLRTLKTGWTMQDRQTYFSWFNRDRAADKHPEDLQKWFADVGRTYGDGSSFAKFMANIKKEAIDNLTDAERQELEPYIRGEAVAFVPMVERKFVKEWTMAEIVPLLNAVGGGRSFEKGREAFVAAQCFACHRFGNEGGAAGPDITGAASRFNRRDLLETIIEPSKVVSDQYQNVFITKKNGDDLVGRIVGEADGEFEVLVNPLADTRVKVKKDQVQKTEPSKLSPMPEGLVNILTREEILDLLAYIESGGNRDHAAFKR